MFILLSSAIAPGLALFSYFYLRNQMATEPRKTLFQSF
ncbi:PrsW family intramembrane metalloprotease, partial [Butyricicoccus sp. 1XD8-22]